jgi:hypothetical protein
VDAVHAAAAPGVSLWTVNAPEFVEAGTVPVFVAAAGAASNGVTAQIKN